MDDSINMSIEPLFGEADYVEWNFSSNYHNSFYLVGSKEAKVYTETKNGELVEVNPLDDPFCGLNGNTVFAAKGVGFVKGWAEVGSEHELVVIASSSGCQQMFSDYKISYPNRFYQIMTELNDSECELIWVSESSLKYAMPKDLIEEDYLGDTPESALHAKFKLGSKVDWRVKENPAIMSVPITDIDDSYIGYTEVECYDVSGVVTERVYRKYLPSVAHISNSREQSIREERFWNTYIPWNRNDCWVYKIEIQLYGRTGDFWVCEEDLTASLNTSAKFYDLVVVSPMSLDIFCEQEAA